MKSATAYLIVVVGVTAFAGADNVRQNERAKFHMTTTDENKAFIKEMLGLKKQLTDYPDRFDLKITMHEPRMLPFGGDYQGMDAFQKFYPEVRSYYDFSTWELL